MYTFWGGHPNSLGYTHIIYILCPIHLSTAPDTPMHAAVTGGAFRLRAGLKPTIGGTVLGTLLR